MNKFLLWEVPLVYNIYVIKVICILCDQNVLISHFSPQIHFTETSLVMNLT